MGPPVDLNLQFSGDTANVEGILDISGIDLVEVKRGNSRRNGGGYRRDVPDAVYWLVVPSLPAPRMSAPGAKKSIQEP